MEQFDLNQIKLKDTGIFEDYNHSFYSVFYKNNITTVGQVLDDNLMLEIIQRCKTKTRTELKGFTNLLKYKYLGVLLPNKAILEQTAKKNDTGKYFYPVDFSLLGIPRYYLDKLKRIMSAYEEDKIENKKLIDIFREIINCGKYWNYYIFIEILKLNIESYEKSQQLEIPVEPQQEHDILVILKDQLVKLISIRDSLDAQIEDIQQKIDEITNSKTEGGASK